MNNKVKILVIDDDERLLNLLEEALSSYNYKTYTKTDQSEALALISEVNFDLVLTDFMMPGLNGLEMIRRIKEINADLPVIMITGAGDMDTVMKTFKAGAYDYIKKPFKWQELIITIQKALEKHALILKNKQYQTELEKLVKEQTAKLEKTNKRLEKTNERLEKNMWGTVLAMISALEASDSYTFGHSERVTAISLIIARQMRCDERCFNFLRLGAVLHDIGKIGIDKNILNKNGVLTEEEGKLLKTHPEIGYNIIKTLDHDEEVFRIVRQHHERFDGKGYPDGLKGDEISYLAKIVSIADTYDAMTSDRPYRKALSHDIAVKEINRGRGTQFDPDTVDAFNKIEKILESKDHFNGSFIEHLSY
ncbi:MAG: two-component system response regulator [Candidatus Cloacimonadota bacterium]|nr:MAG: two-component system response regulator [Candidatus Cloacimonadota bacterium]